MITIFSIPKPFKSNINIIQRNAVNSWKRLATEVEIILCGDEKGVKEICNEFNLIHISDVKKNSYGTPLLDDAFQKSQERATHKYICYVNADIIFTTDLLKALDIVSKWNDKFLIIGRRWDLDIDHELDFNNTDWQKGIKELAYKQGKQKSPEWIDYFIFPKGLINSMPPFAVGRPGWDNWFIWNARSIGIPVVDASDYITPIHQNHDYSHMPQQIVEGLWHGDEAIHNYEMVDGLRQFYKIIDANYKLTKYGVKRNLSYEHFHWRYKRNFLRLEQNIRKMGRYLGLNKLKKS